MYCLTQESTVAVTGATEQALRETRGGSVLELAIGRTQLWWGNIEEATSGFDVVRGSVGQLHSKGGNFSDPLVTETCLADDQAATFVDISLDSPLSGEGHWDLLRGQPGGTYDSGGAGQAAPRDTAIGSSGNGCP
jgi:hypothetical protein